MVGVADRRALNAEGLLGIFYVLDYGATGDGQHADAGGFQAAINAATLAGGGLIAVPPGVYRLERNVVWGTAVNVTIWQHSGASFTGPGTLPAAAGGNTIRVEPSGATIGGASTTQAFGDAPAAGASGLAADSAHRHGMPGAPAAMQQGVNNGQEVWQRGNGPFTLNNAYAADRWQLIIAGTDTLSVSKDTTAANKLANSGAASTLTFTLGTGAGASRYKQRLVIADGYQHLLGQPFSVRAPSRGNAAAAVRAFVTTDGTGGTTTFSGFHSGGGAFENLDVANVIVPADATFVEYGLALAATVTVSLDNVMPTATSTPQPFSGLTPVEDMVRCSRYYLKLGGSANALICRQVPGAINAFGQWYQFPVKMAVIPTVTKVGTWTANNCNQPAPGGIGSDGAELFATSVAAGGANFLCADATTYLTAEANP